MGLYINHTNHDGIFKNKADIYAPNQGFFKRDFMEEMIQAQQKVNASMEKAIANLSMYQKHQDGKHQGNWMKVEKRLQELLNMHSQHEQVEVRVIKQLQKLEEENEKLAKMMKNSHFQEKEKMEHVYSSQQKLLSQLTGYETEVRKLIGKIEAQEELHQQLAGKVEEQEKRGTEALSRLENQEALTEKLLRQFDHFRAALFERTSFLAEKIEESAKFTSAYMTKIVKGKEESTTLYK